MGFFDELNNGFIKLNDATQITRFEDKTIISTIRNYPQSLSANYTKALDKIVENIHQVYVAANDKEFSIGVIGDFTVGKSSFVNAILGDKILPVSSNPTTAIITKIKYGSVPKVIVRYKDDSEEELTYESFIEFSAFNLNDFQERMTEGDIRRFKHVVDATMYVKSAFLKDNNLCIVDTLGLSAHESDNEKTVSSTRDSIATIYLCAERGLSNTDVDFISTYLSPERDDFYMCINRIDLVRKSERGDLSQLVKLKMDDILIKTGQKKDFPLSRIYQVSSLYQEFANGFTDHEDWHAGVNYQEQSGFMRIMNDVCMHVKTNANISRKEAINKQLQKATTQITELMELRKAELDSSLFTNMSKISSLNKEIKNNLVAITSISLSFEKLFNEIYGYSNRVYGDFIRSVNNGWEENLSRSLLNKVSFSVSDYLALEGNILLSLYTITVVRFPASYSIPKSLVPFVKLTIQYLEDKLQPILYYLELQIKSAIKKFVEENNYNDFFDKTIQFDYSLESSIERIDYSFAIYGAVALAATETTWVSNSKRCVKMFNAAKAATLKYVEKTLKETLEKSFVTIRQYLNVCKIKVTDIYVKTIETLTCQVKEFESKTSSLRTQKGIETLYFDDIIAMLSNPVK